MAGCVFSRTTIGPSPVTSIGPTERSTDVVLGVGAVARRASTLGQRLADRDRRTAAVVDAAAVGGAAHLGGHLVERQVEGTHLVVGGGLGPDHRALGERRELHVDGLVVLAGVGLAVDLDVDPDDPVVVLLELGQLLRGSDPGTSP